MTRRQAYVMGALALAGWLGCRSPVPLPEALQLLESGALRGLDPGRTSRQAVILQLGTPTATFEDGRILTYDFLLDRLHREWRGVGSGPEGWMYSGVRTVSVVLVFQSDGTLERKQLVLHEALPAVPVTPQPDA